MTVVSVIIDDQLRFDAEKVAASIGLPLSSGVNVFLREFVAAKGFPFNVALLPIKNQYPVFDKSALIEAIKKAVADENNTVPSENFVYLEKGISELITNH